MVKIEVFSIGCSWCKHIEVVAHAAVEELGLDADIVKLTDPMIIRDRGVNAQPAMFIDGKLMVAGRVPTVSEVKNMLLEDRRRERDQCSFLK